MKNFQAWLNIVIIVVVKAIISTLISNSQNAYLNLEFRTILMILSRLLKTVYSRPWLDERQSLFLRLKERIGLFYNLVEKKVFQFFTETLLLLLYFTPKCLLSFQALQKVKTVRTQLTFVLIQSLLSVTCAKNVNGEVKNMHRLFVKGT